jgi:hypothetical protein
MTRAVLALASLLISAAPAVADTGTVLCGAAHFLRATGEFGSASVTFRNFNPRHSVTIDRITYRDVFGNVVWDSGRDSPTGAPHPRNFDVRVQDPQSGVFQPLDITVVPPGATYYLQTHFIWGFAEIPPLMDRSGRGSAMQVTVKYSTSGRKELFLVTAALRILATTGPGNTQIERTRTGFTCFELGDRDDDD